MPDYTIIAGPNGAGKSTYSSILSSPDALIFDADTVKAIKEREYPDVPDESIQMMITSAYREAEDIAVDENKDLTVETNLRDDFLIDRLSFFKNKGFTTNLIYMLLPDIEASVDRVSLRIAQKGHFVDRESINFNFEQGLINFKKHFNKFDNVRIVDSSPHSDLSFPRTILHFENGHIHFIELNPPSWSQLLLDEIVQKLKTN